MPSASPGSPQAWAHVAAYFRRAGGWTEPVAQRRTPPFHTGDPLYAVWAYTLS